jgi:hypothetical protein
MKLRLNMMIELERQIQQLHYERQELSRLEGKF